MKLLFLLYLALLVDLLAGLPLNLFGFGREPFCFALAVVGFAFVSRASSAKLGMIALVLCALWLALYPHKNGFDVVLAPILALALAAWLMPIFKRSKR